MPLEIKILDYGDIELESSFLVLGRDCGRTARACPTYGFLILGGQPTRSWSTPAIRDNQIMESLGMRGLQFHENMIENQLARHGVRLGDVRYVLHTHLHIDHAGKDDLFPMNTTVVLNRREMEYSVSGLMHPQYPAPDIKHLVDRLHTKGALRFVDLEHLRPGRDHPRRVLRGGERPHRRLDERPRRDRRRHRHHLRRRDLRLQGPDRGALPPDQRRRAAGHRQPRRRSARRRRAIKKLLANARFLLPVHDRPAKVEHGQIVGRLA